MARVEERGLAIISKDLPVKGMKFKVNLEENFVELNFFVLFV